MAGRLQLETRGSASSFLFENPDFSYFTTVHKKHTHFHTINFTLETEKEPNFGETYTFKIPQNYGDLLNKIYFRIVLPQLPTIPGGYDAYGNYDISHVGEGYYDGNGPVGGTYANGFQDAALHYVESIGHALIEYVDLKIGGKTIDRLTGENLQMYSEISDTQGKQFMNNFTYGKPPYQLNTTPVSGTYIGMNTDSFWFIRIPKNEERTLYINIPFYFYNNPQLYLPICSIYKQEIEVEVKFRSIHDLVIEYIHPNSSVFAGWGVTKPKREFYEYIDNVKITDVKCNIEVTFLDTIEKMKIKRQNKDYLMTELQLNSFKMNTPIDTVPKETFNLSFKNPVKELYFFIQRENIVPPNNGSVEANTTLPLGPGTIYVTPFDYDNYTQYREVSGYATYKVGENLNNLSLILDNQVVIDKNVGTPEFLKVIQASIHHNRVPMIRRVYMYSFALKPEDWRPSGHIDFTQIKDQLLDITLNSSETDTYYRNIPGFRTGEPPPITLGRTTFPRNIRVYAKSYNILRVKDGIATKLF